MLALLLVAGIATFFGVRGIVGQFSNTARRLDGESTRLATLQSALDEHETIARQLVDGTPTGVGFAAAAPAEEAIFLAQQNEISRDFDEAQQAYLADGADAAIVGQARTLWQAVLANAGLWGDQLATFVPSTGAQNERIQQQFGDGCDQVRGILSELQPPTLDAMQAGLAHDDGLERTLTAVLAGLFALALAGTVYFRRRMATDLVRPVASLHQGVLKLQAGDYSNRIAVARRDELGALAEAFNEMARALHESHLALTLRATHDPLTGLANRASLAERLTGSSSPGEERRAWHESVLFIDVDDFKDVNDSLGHDGGDALLVQLAARLTECVRPQDLVARLGGDEFAVVLVEGEGAVAATEMAERILDALRAPFLVNGTSLVVSVSIGVAQRRPDSGDAAELLRRSDFAMYMAKGAGKGRYQLFDAQVHDDMVRRSALKTQLALAAPSEQLRLEYQPVADLRTGEVVGVEALVRWQHPTLGVLSPADFITLAEETGDIDAIGCWVLEHASREVASWRRSLDHASGLWLSVNLSAVQLSSASGVAAVCEILANPATQADRIVLEVTETALATDTNAAIASLNRLRSLGVRIAIDDFGTGFSSLSTLATLPVDLLKIDRSFVSGDADVTRSVRMLEGILGLAAKLSLGVIAEGIEQPDQLDLLYRLGCPMGQGFLLCRPAPAPALRALLTSGGLLDLGVPTI
jgi:diguanylate cyclase (GGDEF)-like protein